VWSAAKRQDRIQSRLVQFQLHLALLKTRQNQQDSVLTQRKLEGNGVFPLASPFM